MSYLIHSVEGNRQRLDGGAMFGNVPRALWERWITPDERHRIPLACRTFLIHDMLRERRILLEAGIGVFFEPKLADRFGVEEPGHQLLINLAALGVDPGDVDIVILSHLHFDHAGGLLTPWRPSGEGKLVFPNARFLVGARAWERANEPHFRDRASFVPELHRLLEGSGRLELVEGEGTGLGSPALGPDFSFSTSDGHTPGLLLTHLTGEEGSVSFCGDLIPGIPWVHLPVTMGYDRYPELLIQEKREFLDGCIRRGSRLLFTHDPETAMCGVEKNDKGKYQAVDEIERVVGLEL